MLPDPQSVTVSGTAISLPRIEERANTHVYFNRAENVHLYVTQTIDKKGVLRSSVSLTDADIVTDPITGIKAQPAYSVNINFVQPIGVDSAKVEALYDGLTTGLQASTKALLRKILAGEK